MAGHSSQIQTAVDPHAMKRRARVLTRQRRACVGIMIAAQWTLLNGGTVSAGDGIEIAGDFLQYAIPAAAAGLTVTHRDGQGAFQLGESLAVTVGVTYVLKYAINAPRPDSGGQSMPSGHTSFSFAAAEFMRKRYGWEYGVPAYAAASFVAYSRVEARRHHPRDVVAGAGIGILSSYIFTRPYKGWSIGIEGDTKSFGLRLCRQF
jgi:membrane-associated phospholipid phosphatase